MEGLNACWTVPGKGSGSHETDSSLMGVPMEKELQTSLLHEQGCARRTAFCEQNEPGVVGVSCSSVPARAVSPVSFPTALCCSSGITAW